MRVSDDRYSRDRLRLDLALRFLNHGARTHTIRAWTMLSDDRIRKLYRSYVHSSDSPPRQRGKSPQQVSFFMRGPRAQHETGMLASFFSLLGVVPTTKLADVKIGTLLKSSSRRVAVTTTSCISTGPCAAASVDASSARAGRATPYAMRGAIIHAALATHR
jgi:hypothetical protein